MSGAIDVLDPDEPERVLILASSPAVSEQTAWPIGFWRAELTHPYSELVSTGTALRGLQVQQAGFQGLQARAATLIFATSFANSLLGSQALRGDPGYAKS